jgi:hypothetical protein
MIGTVRIWTVTYLEDDVRDGSLPHEVYENAQVEVWEPDDFEETIRVIERHGLTFSATGTDWAANPDGAYISGYATGENKELTAHLEGFTPAYMRAIVAYIG